MVLMVENNLDSIIQIIMAFLTLCAVVVALFKEDIINFIKKPKIKIDLDDVNCVHKINKIYINQHDGSSCNLIYFRIKVINIGSIAINNIKIKCNEIKLNNKKIYPFDPNYFVWSATHKGKCSEGKENFNLSKNELHYLDLFNFFEGSVNINGNILPMIKQIPIGFPKIKFEKNKIYKISSNINIFADNFSKSANIIIKIKCTEKLEIKFIKSKIIYT